jgi:lipoprotein-anchoring transpeptidase ErfK/SrfK
VLLGVAGVLAAGCSGTPNSITAPATAKTHAAANAKPAAAGLPAKLTITPADRSTHVRPQRDVRVAITRGKMEQVTLITAGSDPVSGALNSAGTAWHSTAPLQPSRRYTVTATAAGPSGKPVTRTSSFRTLTPAATLSAQTLLGHQTYGVGIPIMLTFNRAVRNKAAVERSIELWTSKPVVGAWYWDGNKALDFRPRSYWPQHTRVRFVARLKGVEAAPGVYGTKDLTQSFRIGNSLIAVVSARTHYENIYYRKKLLGHWPVSTGSPGDDTANGTYLTIEKGNPVLMSGPGYTNFPVPWSVRFTWSGNYMHDAYWSVGQQGFTNVSHGCVNMSPAHAETYYKLAVPGDPVTVTGSPAAGIWDDGWTQWFLSWQHLLHGSATHLAVKAGPSGSTFVNPATLPPVAHTRATVTSKPGNYRSR